MANPNMQNSGGPVIANVALVPIIWGSQWPYGATSPLPAQLLAFMQYFVGPNSTMLAVLEEYNANGITIGPGGVLNNQFVNVPGSPSSPLLDSKIQSTLSSWISNQNNQTPNFPQPNPNTVYVLFVPQSIVVVIDDIPGNLGTSCSVFAGYHYSSGSGALYVVVPCCSPPGTPYSTVLNNLTLALSHEICESITDPRSNGWRDQSTKGEIGDICQGTGYAQFAPQTAGNVPPGAAQTFAVQAIWSQVQNNCVFGPPSQLIGLSLPYVVYGGQPLTGTVSLNDDAPAVPATGVSVTLSSDNLALKFSAAAVPIPPGNAQATISATTTAVADTVVATVWAKLGQQTFEQPVTVLSPKIAVFFYTPGSAQGYQYPPNAPVGTLSLNVPAPAGGLNVNLVSSEPALVVPEPDILSIAAGAETLSSPFYLQVNPAGADTPVTITASVSGSSIPFVFTVKGGGPPNIKVKTLTISPPSVIGGATTWGHFTLISPVGAGGGSIVLSNSDPTVATVPGTVPLSAGATGGTFAISTMPLQPPTTVKHCTIGVAQNTPPAFALLTVTS